MHSPSLTTHRHCSSFYPCNFSFDFLSFFPVTAMETLRPHAALLSCPGIGHLIPLLELGKHLVTHHNFSVTIFVLSSLTSPVESQFLQSAISPNLLDVVELPPVDISGLIEPNAAVVTLLAVIMREVPAILRSAISQMKFRPSVLIVDMFGTESLVVGEELKIPKYIYVPSNAWFLALTVYASTLDKLVEGEYVDQKEPLRIPGCRPVRPEDVVEPMLDRSNQQYREYIRMSVGIPTADGILLNTWEDLQRTTLAALRDDELLGRVLKVPVYPVGPLKRPVGPPGLFNELFRWLDKQPNKSVIYVSFGSGGTLSAEQMSELAWGLELSRQRFLWVVRPPTVKNPDEAFFTAGKVSNDEVSDYLPDGFLTRTQNVGLVVPLWAPQTEILAHPSVGGFLSHCGWNSTLESLVNAVPMIAWPLYAEQRMNATLLVEELGVAVRLKVFPSVKVVRREEIEVVVRRIMEDNKEGNEIREKVKEVKKSAEKALSSGGTSCTALAQMEKQCIMSMQKGNNINEFSVEPR